MQDLELFELLLEIKKPWIVSNINVDVPLKKVLLSVEYPKKTKAPCPRCKKECPVNNRNVNRSWRHLDVMQFETTIESAIPRINCQEHGILTIDVPWAEAKNRYTFSFEKFAIHVLQNAATQDSAKNMLRLSWDEVHGVMERAVERGLKNRVQENLTYIGIDEKSFLTGHKYITVLHNNETGKVIDVVQERTEAAAKILLNKIPLDQRNLIKAVTMDMWPAYINSVNEILPNADIVHDKFHIKGYLNKSVDIVRRQEHAELLKENDGTLTKTKYLWLKNTENLTESQDILFKELMLMHLNVGKAWSIKESFGNFWDYKSEAWANKFFNRWFFWATHSKLEPIIKVAYMLKNHFEGIITYIKHKITNSVAEGINSNYSFLVSNQKRFSI